MAGSSSPVTPRMQQLCLEHSPRTGRSADSGYASLETSPTRSPPKRRLNGTSLSLSTRLHSVSVRFYDGNSSEESQSRESSHDEADPGIIGPPSSDREKFATLPRVSRRRFSRTDSFPVLPDRKCTQRRHDSDNTGLNGSRVCSLRALDRFVPLRDHATPGSEKHRTTKHLADLTPSERLVRHNHDAPDPFCFRRRALPPSPIEARKAREPGRSRTILDRANPADRRVSLPNRQTYSWVPNALSFATGVPPDYSYNDRYHFFFPPSFSFWQNNRLIKETSLIKNLGTKQQHLVCRRHGAQPRCGRRWPRRSLHQWHHCSHVQHAISSFEAESAGRY